MREKVADTETRVRIGRQQDSAAGPSSFQEGRITKMLLNVCL